MTRKEGQKIIDLIMAQLNGEQVQVVKSASLKASSGKIYEDVELVPILCYKVGTRIYPENCNIEYIRVKPEPIYVPYSIEDLTQHMIKGTKFTNTVGNTALISDTAVIEAVHRSGLIRLIFRDGGDCRVTPENLLKAFTTDNKPAGNIMEKDND